MDLNKLDLSAQADKGADLSLEHPVTGEELGITITLLGTDSAVYRNHARELQRARIAKMAKSRNKKIDFSVTEDEEADALAVCTVGWSGVVLNGKELEFSHDAAVDLYVSYPWIKEQVDAFIGDRANFLAS